VDNKAYPLELVSIKNGPSLFVPIPALIKTTYENLVASNPTTIFPYWAKIWASAFAMLEFLQEQPLWIHDKIVLEIGAGIGVPSLSIAAQTHKIIISDYAPDAVTVIQKNIKHLKLTNALAVCIDWNHIPDDIIADTILLSDTNYEPAAHNHLVSMIDALINKGSTVIVATPNRLASNPFIESVSKYMYHSTYYSINENETTSQIAVMVLKK
jgi:predicted nicotinamide N-methyase